MTDVNPPGPRRRRPLNACGALLVVAVTLMACGGAVNGPRGTATPSPRETGIPSLDRFLTLIRTRDTSGLTDSVGFERQICVDEPEEAEEAPVCETVRFDGDATVEMTASPVFTYSGRNCARSYATGIVEAGALIEDYLSRHPILTIYGAGEGGAMKFDEGHRVVVIDGHAPGDAHASIWYLRPDGAIVSVVEECEGLDVAAFVDRTGTLVRPVLAPMEQRD